MLSALNYSKIMTDFGFLKANWKTF